jgi:hypothetical protein
MRFLSWHEFSASGSIGQIGADSKCEPRNPTQSGSAKSQIDENRGHAHRVGFAILALIALAVDGKNSLKKLIAILTRRLDNHSNR